CVFRYIVILRPGGEIGKRGGLKIRCPQGLVGSSPTPGMTTVARAAGGDDLRAKSTQGSTKAPDLSANGGAGRCLFVSAGPLYPSRAGVPGPRGRVCAEALPSGRRVGEGGGTGSCRSAGRPAAARGEGGDVPLSRECHARRVEAGRPGNGPSWSRPRVCSGVGRGE